MLPAIAEMTDAHTTMTSFFLFFAQADLEPQSNQSQSLKYLWLQGW
jgi:hypothetical protein